MDSVLFVQCVEAAKEESWAELLTVITCTLCWLESKESLRKIERNAKINVERDEHAEGYTSIDARPLTRGESLHSADCSDGRTMTYSTKIVQKVLSVFQV